MIDITNLIGSEDLLPLSDGLERALQTMAHDGQTREKDGTWCASWSADVNVQHNNTLSAALSDMEMMMSPNYEAPSDLHSFTQTRALRHWPAGMLTLSMCLLYEVKLRAL